MTTTDTTQARHPWRATARTAFAFIVALAAVWPTLVAAAGVDPGLRVVAATIAVASAVTRIMAAPGFSNLLDRFAPWLLPEPRALDEDHAYGYDPGDVARLRCYRCGDEYEADPDDIDTGCPSCGSQSYTRVDRA